MLWGIIYKSTGILYLLYRYERVIEGTLEVINYQRKHFIVEQDLLSSPISKLIRLRESIKVVFSKIIEVVLLESSK